MLAVPGYSAVVHLLQWLILYDYSRTACLNISCVTKFFVKVMCVRMRACVCVK